MTEEENAGEQKVEEEEDEDEWPFSDRKKRLYDGYFGLLSGNSNESTIQTRKSNIRTYFEWIEDNDIELEELTSSDMTDYASELQNRGMADPSIGACVDAVAIFYVWLSEEKEEFDIDTNPLEGWSLGDHDFLDIDPNTSKQRAILQDRGDTDDAIIALPKEDVEKMIANPGSPSLLKELVIRLYWETGVRGIELSEISKKDIDRDEQKIRITTAKTDKGDENRTRYVFYSDETEYLLTEWLDYDERELLNPQAPAWEDDEENVDFDPGTDNIEDWEVNNDPYLLVTDQSSQIRPSWASKVVKDAAKRAGVNEPLYQDAADKIRWLVTGHTLRHSHISYHCNVLKTPLHMVAKLAGHKKLDTTKKYVSTDWEKIAEEAKEFF